jgi:hypothetical protein
LKLSGELSHEAGERQPLFGICNYDHIISLSRTRRNWPQGQRTDKVLLLSLSEIVLFLRTSSDEDTTQHLQALPHTHYRRAICAA